MRTVPIPITRGLAAAIIIGAAAGVTGRGTGAAAHAAYAPASVQGTGSWVDAGICAPIAPPPGTDIACAGSTIWHGPLLMGTTTYTVAGTFTAAGDIVGTATETFTGSAANGAQGTIDFIESLSLRASGEILVSADAVGGTGDFCHVRGHLVFTGISDPNGIGGGSYSGHLVTPKNCR